MGQNKIETQYIYWSNLCSDLNLDLEPKPLLVDIAKSQSEYNGQNWIGCPAIKDKHFNTFLTYIPSELNIKIENNIMYANDPKVNSRLGLYKNSYAFNWEIERIFFSELPQVMEVTPAYLHKTSYSQYGHAPSGAFDIGRWFRPSSPTFQMWPDETKFIAKKGEAHLYYNFPSKSKIVLKEFIITDKLKEIMFDNINYKRVVPKQKLESIYDMFENTGKKEIVLSEIKNNLL